MTKWRALLDASLEVASVIVAAALFVLVTVAIGIRMIIDRLPLRVSTAE